MCLGLRHSTINMGASNTHVFLFSFFILSPGYSSINEIENDHSGIWVYLCMEQKKRERERKRERIKEPLEELNGKKNKRAKWTERNALFMLIAHPMFQNNYDSKRNQSEFNVTWLSKRPHKHCSFLLFPFFPRLCSIFKPKRSEFLLCFTFNAKLVSLH